MRYQLQRKNNNCGQTCLGMILGWDQALVATTIGKRGKTTWNDLRIGLEKCSKVMRLVHVPMRVTNKHGLHFGQVMICRVKSIRDKKFNHWIVINEKGKVLDPMIAMPLSLEEWKAAMNPPYYIATFSCLEEAMQELSVRHWIDQKHSIKGSATFSTDEKYRYRLVREWGANQPMVFIMLNPSTADEQFLDPTVTRCVGFAQRENAGALIVLNLFALRSTDPLALYQNPNPVGPHNDAVFVNIASNARIVVAWGNHADARRGRVKTVLALIGSRELLCLGTTKNGQPKHPLYIKKDTALVQWNFK